MDADMRQVDAVIRDRLASRVALINQISTYIVSAGGKRIRPRLVLLFAQALLGTGDVAGAQEELRRAATSGGAPSATEASS